MERNFQFSSAWSRLMMRSTWIWPIKNSGSGGDYPRRMACREELPYGSGEHAVCSRSPAP